MNRSTRTVAEVFEHHVKALNAGDLDGVAFDYGSESIFITKDGVLRGPDAIRQWFHGALTGPLVGAQFRATTLLSEGDILYLEWEAEGQTHKASGVDTFVIRGGAIEAQTVRLLDLSAK